MRMRGLEPPRVTPHDPKSCASASSATSALFFNELKFQPKPGITFDQFFHYFRVIISVQKHTTLLEVLNATTLQMFKTFCPSTKKTALHLRIFKSTSYYTIIILRQVYFGRDFSLRSEGVMKCPGG